MTGKRGFVSATVLGAADTVKSTNIQMILARITHWCCFGIAVAAALKFTTLYLSNGFKWSYTDVTDREMLQLVSNQSLWLFICGISLLTGFVAWLNADALMNRRILLDYISGTHSGEAANPAASATLTLQSTEKAA